MSCPRCKSEFYPWHPCCHNFGDDERIHILNRSGHLDILIKFGLYSKENKDEEQSDEIENGTED